MLLEVAQQRGVALTVDRDSADKDVAQAFRTVMRKAHPDGGGEKEQAQGLNDANAACECCLRLCVSRCAGVFWVHAQISRSGVTKVCPKTAARKLFGLFGDSHSGSPFTPLDS